MSEQLFGEISPEYASPHSPEEQRLAEVLTMPSETASVLRPQLWSIVDQALSTAVGTHEQQSLYFAGNTLDWQFFSRPGDPLPPGLVLVSTGDQLLVEFDTRLQFNHSCFSAATNKFKELGLDLWLDVVEEDEERREPEIDRAIEAVVRQNPAYAFLLSFGIHNDQQDQPISPFWRTVREQQIEHQVRQKYLMGPQAPLYAELNAAREYTRKLARIEEETASASTQKPVEQTALERARQYFASRLLDTFIADNPHRRHQREKLMQELLSNGPDPEILDYTSTTAERQYQELAGCDNPLAELVGRRVLRAFISHVFESSSYARAMEEAFAWGIALLKHTVARNSRFRPLPSTEYHEHLFRPTGNVVPYKALAPSDELMNYHSHEIETGFVEEAAIEGYRQRLVGNVESGNRPEGDRLIQTAPKNEHLPSNAPGGYEFSLRLSATVFAEFDPEIPGFQLIARRNDSYRFARLEHDPYAQANIPLIQSERAALADVYRQLGLQGPAQALLSHQTVGSLVELLKNFSRYVIPADGGDVNFPSTLAATELEQFAPLVRHGQLSAQCSVSAKFLKLSLEEIFGTGTASIIEGWSLSDSSITAERHAQVAFAHEGRLYILDATPSANTTARALPALRRPRFRLRRREPLAPEAASLTALAAATPRISSEARREQTVAAIRQTLESNLRLVLRVDTPDDLYEKVIQLPQDADPIRRTVEATLQASKGEITASELSLLTNYLAAYKKASSEIRAQMRVASYDDSLLNLLQSTAASLVRHLAEADG